MKHTLAVVVLLTLGLAPSVRAQHILAVKEGDATEIVVGAKGMAPLVLEDGKLRVANALRYAFGPGGEYLPFYVAVRDLEVRRSGERFRRGGGSTFNKEFHLHCTLETAYRLKDVFMVVTTKNELNDLGIFVFEVGTLEPREPKPYVVDVPTEQRAIPGHYHVYLFSAGKELLVSLMPKDAVEAAYARMVRERIRGVADAEAAPLVGPQPEYPKALKRAKIDGSATLAFTVDERGAISEPSVVKASRPEFGAAALAVIGDWRFLPKVSGGNPVKCRVELPFNFAWAAK